MAWCGRQVGGDEGSRSNGNAHDALQSGATLPLLLMPLASLSTPITSLSLFPQPEMLSSDFLGVQHSHLSVISAKIHLILQHHPRDWHLLFTWT